MTVSSSRRRLRRLQSRQNGGGSGVITRLSLAAFDIDDDADAGSVIGALSMPEGYTAEIVYDCEGRFAVNGSDLITGAALLAPGTYRPYVRAVKQGALDLVIRPRITVAANWEPSDISNLAAAWVCDQGVTTNGSNEVTSWAGAFGTAVNLTGAAGSTAPSIVAGNGPDGLTTVGIAGGKWMAFSENVDIDDCTIVICWRPRGTDGTTRYSLGNSTSGFALAHHSNIYDVNFGSTGSVVPAANYNIVSNRYQCAIITHDGTGGSGPTAAYTDGGAAGSSVNCGTTARTINALGKNGATINESADYAAILIYQKVLSADEIARVEAWAQRYRTTKWYFDDAAPDNSASGFGPAFAKQNPQTNIAGSSTTPPNFRPGDRILMKGGGLFTGLAITATGTMTTTQARPITIGSYGTGKARVWGAAASALSWTQGDGDVWSVVQARTNVPRVLWWYRDGINANPVRVYQRSTSSAESFAHSAGAFSINLGPGVNPNEEILVISADSSTQSIFNVTRNDVVFIDLDIRHYAAAIWAPQGSRNAIRECDIGWTNDDGLSPGGSSNVGQFVKIRGCGGSRSTSSGPGDGVSFHGGSGHLIQYCDIADCSVSGIRNEMGTGSKIEGNKIVNCNQAIRALYNASYDFAVTWVVRANQITRSADDQESAGIKIDSGCTANQAFDITDNLFAGLGAVRGKAIDNASGNAVVSQARNTQEGFSTLV